MTDERTDERAEHPGVSHRAITRIDRTGATHDDTWASPWRHQVAILINGVPWTVMLATPSDLEDLAIGMLLTEHVIDSASRITSIGVGELLDEFTVSVDIPDEAIDREALGTHIDQQHGLRTLRHRIAGRSASTSRRMAGGRVGER